MKKAFTFIETMLTLSIIGVLFAIMIPILDRTKPDDVTLNYRKTFYTIEEAVASMINDKKLYSSGDLAEPITGTDTNGKIFCRNLINSLNTIGKTQCHGDSGYSELSLVNSKDYKGSDMVANNVNFKLSNGAAIGGIHGNWSNINDDLSVVSDETEKFITLCIDTNGFAKGPNKGCSTDSRAIDKRDQYRIRISREGKVYTGNTVGPNNWYMENYMLLNPRMILKQKLSWTDSQITNLKKAASDENIPSMTDSNDDLDELGYTWNNNANRWIFTGNINSTKRK